LVMAENVNVSKENTYIEVNEKLNPDALQV
jgi:hypothetical protein